MNNGSFIIFLKSEVITSALGAAVTKCVKQMDVSNFHLYAEIMDNVRPMGDISEITREICAGIVTLLFEDIASRDDMLKVWAGGQTDRRMRAVCLRVVDEDSQRNARHLYLHSS